ncbi:MAG: response regulator [Lyngbya sp. HA4199-MV5]|jgi:chemotaxis protein histidine kinase CheA|nr:response regulator [Lyngbya sp. HA4199-MV5]
MSIPEIDSSQRFEAIADEQLQQELRGLFAVDTQHYLQKYSQIAQSLQAQSWRSDIQELYRCVHTIKGGAVTIGAEAVLHIATALEDVLADLRYLEVAPNLTDRHLSQVLMEAGELLTGSLEAQQQAEGQEPILNRIQTIHQEIRERYLPQWDEVSQIHQAFAEEGLDLVVLELEITLERQPEAGIISDSTIYTAQQILEQLAEIGEEIHLASGWSELLQQAQPLLEQRDSAVWRSQWTRLLQALKTCAKQGGKPVLFAFDSFQSVSSLPTNSTHSLPTHSLLVETDINDPNAWVADLTTDSGMEAFTQFDIHELNIHESGIQESDIQESDIYESDIHESDIQELNIHKSNSHEPDALLDYLETDSIANVGTFLDALDPVEAVLVEPIDGFTDPFLDPIASLTSHVSQPEQSHLVDDRQTLEEAADGTNDALHPSDDRWELESDFAALSQPVVLPASEIVLDWLEQPSAIADAIEPRSPMLEQRDAIEESQSLHPASVATPNSSPKPDQPIQTLEKVQIPVPLESLDQSAQHLVETLLTLRTTQGFYQALQSQIAQIMTLAQEGTQYITHLRQIQDDYTLLEELSQSAQATAGPTPERYRQGYTIINRLLETSLRLSEIGAETGKTTQQIATYLQTVDRNVLKLQSTIEDSRLVPFQNLGFRARAILRDLTTRYNKPAQLLVQGEKTELDVTIARNLEPALLHLIRNAYDHGLETPAERTAQGKAEQGTITLSLQRQGNRFQFEIQDDGRGINASAIQARAEALRLPLSNTQTPAELLAVICQPGFSAQNQVSEISGRGVGMDVVAAQVVRLGGRLSLNTVPGSGTTFQIQFPVPRLLVPCVLLQAGDQTVAIPEDDIRTITLLGNLDASLVKETSQVGGWTIHSQAGSLPALDLLKYWQPQAPDRTLADTTVCVYVALAGAQQGAWLLTDALLEQAELIINPIPQPLIVPSGLIGVSLQANGALVPVLEAQALVEKLLTAPMQSREPASITTSDLNHWNADHPTHSILIVDDAALMRRRLEASLHSNGYLTHTCADGQEAWHWLQANPHPNLVITDIEMPNMDGFTLIDRCRQADIHVPILVVSSRLSEEWFDEARRLGANDYLTKGFSTTDLLKKVNALLNLVVH